MRSAQVGPLQFGPKEGFGVNLLLSNPHKFNVFDRDTQQVITFAQDGEAILVVGLDRDSRVTLTLDDLGRCKFVLDGEELDSWQLLKRVLQPLFLGA